MFGFIKRWFFCLIYNVIGLTLLVSLMSYNPQHTSLLFSSSIILPVSPIQNFFDTINGFLLYYFGMSSLLLIPLSILHGLRYIKYKISIDNARAIGLLCMIPLMSTILARYCLEFFSNVCPGGAIGYNFLYALLYYFDEPIVDVALFFLLWSFLVVVLRFSFIGYLKPLCLRVQALLLKLAFNFDYVKEKAELLQKFLPKKAEKVEEPIYNDPFWTDYMNPACADGIEIDEHQIKQDEQILNIAYKLPQPKAKQLKEYEVDKGTYAETEAKARALEHKLERFGIQGKITSITHGPVVTLFEYKPAIDTKISNILAREDDLALALQAVSLRIIAPIPGRSVIGFEVAHSKRRPVLFAELIQSNDFAQCKGSLPLILGKDTLGSNIVIDLSIAPHLLVAGSTGSGKSVGLHAMFMSLLCCKTPQELRCIIIDPKRLEFSAYEDIAHLLFPIITDPARALTGLKWAVKTMEDRYSIMAKKGVRNINEYNLRAVTNNEEILPYIVIIIDELADLMMTAGKDIEHLIARLAQMARAAGIHMVVATQRPSVDVITGLIKVNFPSRVAFKVTSKVDSRTIIDAMGAEKLLGKGDMLFLDGKGGLHRVHGAYVTEEEIVAVVNHIKAQQQVEYITLNVEHEKTQEPQDELFSEILTFIDQKNEISISLLQRAFRIGYNRSARIMDLLEMQGYIMPTDGSKMRKVIKKDL